jgi:hypothetical protein
MSLEPAGSRRSEDMISRPGRQFHLLGSHDQMRLARPGGAR